MREQLLRSLRERIRRYSEHGDASGVLSPGALQEADALTLPGTAADPEVLHVVATLNWCRYRARSQGEGGPDLARALRLFAAVRRRDPGGSRFAVPRSVQLVLECRD